MTTTNETMLSSEAHGLLDCFGTTIDEQLADMAEKIARIRITKLVSSTPAHGPVCIEAEDVKRAGNAVLQAFAFLDVLLDEEEGTV